MMCYRRIDPHHKPGINWMTSLKMREDEFSFQVTHPAAELFFIRITSSKYDRCSMVFSDFRLSADEDDRGIEALHLIAANFHGPTVAMRLLFINIYPAYSFTSDKDELVRRHDQISGVFGRFAKEVRIPVHETVLHPRRGGFDMEIRT